MPFIKTGLIGLGAATLIGGTLLAWGPASSYLRTGWRSAGEAAHQMVPTTFEIDRIETLVGDLEEVINEQEAKLIKQRLDLEYLQADVDRCEQEVGHLTAEVRNARQVLHVQRASYTIGGTNYDRATVVREATGKAERLVRAREIADAKRQTMEALQSALSQAEAQLAEARKQRETYRLRLAELDAKAENVEIRRQLAVSLDRLPGAIDAGAFQEVEAAFTRVEKDLAVQDRILEERYKRLPAHDEISFTGPAETDVLATLDAALDRPGTLAETERMPAELEFQPTSGELTSNLPVD